MIRSYTLRSEVPDDHDAVHALHHAAFGDDDAVPNLVADLRRLDAPFPTVSIVAVDNAGTVVGHVMLSHAWVDAEDRLVDVMILSPLGVHPTAQNQGIGTALIDASLKAAAGLGAPLVFLEGHDRYYGPRGFEKAMSLGFRRPSLRMPENAFQVARLPGFDGAMTGTFVYRDVHWRHGIGRYSKG